MQDSEFGIDRREQSLFCLKIFEQVRYVGIWVVKPGAQWVVHMRNTVSTPTWYEHLIIMDSLVCSCEKKALTLLLLIQPA